MKEELLQKAPKNMTFTGYTRGTELAEIYSASTLFVFPSSTETFGNVVLESLASGTPAIVAKSGGVQEIVSHMKNGIHCEPRNSEEFIKAIQYCLEHPVHLRQMEYEARNYALNQSWDSILDQLLLDYEKTIIESKNVQRYA